MSQKELFFSAPLSPSPRASSSTYLFQGTMLQGVLASKVEKSSVAFIERHMGIGTALNLPPHEPLPVMSQWDGQDNANISDNDRWIFFCNLSDLVFVFAGLELQLTSLTGVMCFCFVCL